MPLSDSQRQILQYLNSHQITPIDALAEVLAMDVRLARSAVDALIDVGYALDHNYLGSATVSITEIGRRALRRAIGAHAVRERSRVA
jgi:predicted transcriptional regulator